MTISREFAIAHLKSLGFRNSVASLIGLTQEALSRGVTVSRNPRGRTVWFEFDGKRQWWEGGNNSVNTRLAKRVSRYKSVTNLLLRQQGVNAAPSTLFEAGDAEAAWAWAKKFGSVVVKPDDGQGGKDVYLNISDEAVFLERFNHIGQNYQLGVVVEPFYQGNQYRAFVIDGKLVAASHMRPASVVGDGGSSILKLVREKNKGRERHPSHIPIRVTGAVKEFLAAQGKDLRTVPAKGERVFLSGLSNLQRGGDSVDVTDEVPDELRDTVLASVRALPGMRIVGIDVLYGAEGVPNRTVILEINTSPQLSIHQHPWEGTPRKVEVEVMDAFFPSSRSTA